MTNLTSKTLAIALTMAATAVACEATTGGGGGAPDACAYALGTESALHVSQTCGVAGGDGSIASPYGTLAEAAAAAEVGSTIALAPGAYVGGIELAAGVNLVGFLDEHVSITGDGEHVLAIKGAGKTEVRGLTVTGAAKRGIVVTDTAITLGAIGLIIETLRDARRPRA